MLHQLAVPDGLHRMLCTSHAKGGSPRRAASARTLGCAIRDRLAGSAVEIAAGSRSAEKGDRQFVEDGTSIAPAARHKHMTAWR